MGELPAGHLTDRRTFLGLAAAGAGAVVATPTLTWADHHEQGDKPLYQISLAEWSLHRTFGRDGKDHLRFPEIAKQQCGIDAVEYVNQFFMEQARDQAYLKELKDRAADQGVRNLLIMCDGEGQLGDPDDQKRSEAVENHRKWLEAAKFLGCHSIRVNAQSSGPRDEQSRLAADGLRKLSEVAASYDLNVLVENHGGLSSDGEWLAGVMQRVDLPNCGTLPDFGNFRISDDQSYDRYKGVRELMPYAKAVSAKSHEFDEQGNEVHTDYHKMMKIVVDAGYHGYVGIEWEGDEPDEIEGILLTKQLLERVRQDLAG